MVSIEGKGNENKWLVVGAALIVFWIIYFFFFYKFYQEATFFTALDANSIITSVFVTKYYGSQLLWYMLVAFALSSVSVTLFIIYRVKLDNDDLRDNKETKIVGIMLLGICLLSSIVLLVNMIWPITILIIVVTGLLGYIFYALYRKNYREDKISYEDDEIIRTAGPFESEADADDYFNQFYQHWHQHFEEKRFHLLKDVYLEGEQYYVDAYIHFINEGEKKSDE